MPFISILAVHLPLSLIPCFFINAMFWTFWWLCKLVSQLPDQQTILGFLHCLLKYSRMFPEDLFWDPWFSICLLITYMLQLTVLGIYFLLMISKSTMPLNLLKTEIYYSPTLHCLLYEIQH
jgi:hypothetical protein